MTEYMAVWLVYDTKNPSKKVYDTIRDFVYDTKRGCNFFGKKGCMTQKCMSQNVRPFEQQYVSTSDLMALLFH